MSFITYLWRWGNTRCCAGGEAKPNGKRANSNRQREGKQEEGEFKQVTKKSNRKEGESKQRCDQDKQDVFLFGSSSQDRIPFINLSEYSSNLSIKPLIWLRETSSTVVDGKWYIIGRASGIGETFAKRTCLHGASICSKECFTRSLSWGWSRYLSKAR